MKTITGWWFAKDKVLPNGDGRQIRIGRTHKVKGAIVPCKHGLHLSKRIIDALSYAPGPIVYRVEGSGIIVPHGNPINKYACSERTYLEGGVDVSESLRLFARKCALDVIHLWDAPEIVIRYLKTGDESIRAAARDAWYASTSIKEKIDSLNVMIAAKHNAKDIAVDIPRANAKNAAVAAAINSANDTIIWSAWTAARPV